MSRYITVKPHMTVKELDQMIKSVKGFWKVQQILVIRNAINKRKTSKELSEIVNLSSHTIVKLVQKYNKEGKTFFDRKGKGGRKYGYMSLEQEKDFLEQCQKKGCNRQNSWSNFITNVKPIVFLIKFEVLPKRK